MHENGFQRLDKCVCNKDAYDGISTKPFVNIIKKIIAFCNFVAENDKMVHRCIEINDTFNKYS